MKKHKSAKESEIIFTELMVPSNSNFGGKIHGGYILSLMDKIAFACASRHSKLYCVTASVNRVSFMRPIEVGELVTMKASVNYVGRSSMVVGIRVESQSITTGEKKHCNSSYFNMVAIKDGKPHAVPGLILDSKEDARRFLRSAEFIKANRERSQKYSESSDLDDNYKGRFEEYNVVLENF